MITISPSILASNFMELSSEIKKLNLIDDIWVHLDVMDGHFVPNLTFGHDIIKNITKQSKNNIDVHLMVNNPDFYIASLKNFGIHNITWHLENIVNHEDLILNAKKYYRSVGLSIKPQTKPTELPIELLKMIDLVLVMSVEPGFGGQKFMNEAIDKVIYLNKLKKSKNLDFVIQVDGGIDDTNAKMLTDAGATNLVAGSFIFKENIETQVKKLRINNRG